MTFFNFAAVFGLRKQGLAIASHGFALFLVAAALSSCGRNESAPQVAPAPAPGPGVSVVGPQAPIGHGPLRKRDLPKLSMLCSHGEGLASMEELRTGARYIDKQRGKVVKTHNQHSLGRAKLRIVNGQAEVAIRIFDKHGRLLKAGRQAWAGPVEWPNNWFTLMADRHGEIVTLGCAVVWPQ